MLEWLAALARPAALLELALLVFCLGLAWVVAARVRPRGIEVGIWFGARGFDGLLFPLLALALALLARWLMRGHGPVFQLAVPVLAGSAAYAVAETFSWRIGLGLSLAEARGFYFILTVATLLGVAIDLSGVDSIKMLFWAAIINGVVSVPIMVVMMLLAAKPAVMGRFVIGKRLRLLGWAATAVMAAAVIAMFVVI